MEALYFGMQTIQQKISVVGDTMGAIRLLRDREKEYYWKWVDADNTNTVLIKEYNDLVKSK